MERGALKNHSQWRSLDEVMYADFELLKDVTNVLTNDFPKMIPEKSINIIKLYLSDLMQYENIKTQLQRLRQESCERMLLVWWVLLADWFQYVSCKVKNWLDWEEFIKLDLDWWGQKEDFEGIFSEAAACCYKLSIQLFYGLHLSESNVSWDKE